MSRKSSSNSTLHIRNKHRGEYDLPILQKTNPFLKVFVFTNEWGKETIDFSNPKAVLELNKAILFSAYKLKHWEIAKNSLCPAIPGRADYIHYVADLIEIKESNDKESAKKILDIGTGSSLIYPILGVQEYNWDFVATEIDRNSIYHAEVNINKNSWLKKKIELRFQNDKEKILEGVISDSDWFDAILCNPPFFKSREDNWTSSTRKFQNLKKDKNTPTIQNFSGQPNELWYPGGEKAFVTKLIYESRKYKKQINWVTTLISDKNNLKPLIAVLEYHKAKNIEIIPMKHGQKITRILAWQW